MDTTFVRRWSRVWTPAFATLSVLMLAAGVRALVQDTADWQGWLFFFMYAVLGALIAWNCRREGVRVDAAGLTLLRLVGERRVPWAQVGDVATGRDGQTWSTWRVVLRDGGVLDTHLRRTDPALGEAVAAHRRGRG